MPFTYSQGSIAGVSLTSGDPCKALLVDAARLKSTRFINNRIAADGTVFVQSLNTGSAGHRFGVQLEFVPVSIFNNIIAAINNAIDTQDTFNVSLQDDIQSVNTDCVVDGSDWLTYPAQRTTEDGVRDVTMRFITTT